MNPVADQAAGWLARLEAALDSALPSAERLPAHLHDAMRYATRGGKRVRALICYAAGQVLGTSPDRLDSSACAVELIHAYSLVHDDLPCMDDDVLRRGQPTVHVKYGEATAVLVGDALQALAFQVIADDEELSEAARLRMIQTLSRAVGSLGMVGGQAIDLASEGKSLNLAELEALHVHKTGALIHACTRLACEASESVDPNASSALEHFGNCVGLAFQIQDDLLDIEGTTESLGKEAGKDEHHLKSTYPSVMGIRSARDRAVELFADARQSATQLGGDASALLWIVDMIEHRTS